MNSACCRRCHQWRLLALCCLQDRKVMIKTMKPNVVELSKHEQGHLVLIRALDVVDDTVCGHG